MKSSSQHPKRQKWNCKFHFEDHRAESLLKVFNKTTKRARGVSAAQKVPAYVSRFQEQLLNSVK